MRVKETGERCASSCAPRSQEERTLARVTHIRSRRRRRRRRLVREQDRVQGHDERCDGEGSGIAASTVSVSGSRAHRFADAVARSSVSRTATRERSLTNPSFFLVLCPLVARQCHCYRRCRSCSLLILRSSPLPPSSDRTKTTFSSARSRIPVSSALLLFRMLLLQLVVMNFAAAKESAHETADPGCALNVTRRTWSGSSKMRERRAREPERDCHQIARVIWRSLQESLLSPLCVFLSSGLTTAALEHTVRGTGRGRSAAAGSSFRIRESNKVIY